MLISVSTRQFADESSLFDALTSILAPAFNGDKATAVFDADGTLWRKDATECFLFYLESVGLLRPPTGWSTLQAYLDHLYGRSYRDACRYCATVFEGLPVEDVLAWSESSFHGMVAPSLVGVTRRLVMWLQENDVQVHVVSASPWWAIRPGTRLLGIPDQYVHAIDAHTINGRFTGQFKGRLQSGSGKAETVSELPIKPLFVAGNTVDDAAMMQLATVTALAVEPMALADDERNLEAIARLQGWFVLK